MNDSLITIIDSIKNVQSNQIKDTLHVLSINANKDFMDILPIIIACLALILSSVAAYISKKSLDANIRHNKLSVIPALNYYEDFSLRPNSVGVGLLVKNVGIGPALIKSFKLEWGDIQINSQEDFSKIPKHNLFGIFEGGFISNKGIINNSEKKWILRIPLNNLMNQELSDNAIDTDKVDIIRKELQNNVRLEIIYRSFYDEEEYEFSLHYPSINT